MPTPPTPPRPPAVPRPPAGAYPMPAAGAPTAAQSRRECPVCGTTFVRVGLKTYCSRSCKEKAKSRERQAVMREADMGLVALRTFVAERDGWICQICKKPIDRELAYPHPKSRSLDHTVSLALGGEHTPENSQIAHLDCNQSKNKASEDKAPKRVALAPKRVTPYV